MNQQTNPHRAGTKAAEKWDKRQRKITERAERAEALAAELQAADEATKRVPNGFSDWGAIRTQAWAHVAKLLRGLVRLKHHAPRHLDAMKALRGQLGRIPDASVEDCAQIINATTE